MKTLERFLVQLPVVAALFLAASVICAAFGAAQDVKRKATFIMNGAVLNVEASYTDVVVCDPDKGALGIPYARIKFGDDGRFVYVSGSLTDECYLFKRDKGFPGGPYDFIVIDTQGARVLQGQFVLPSATT